MTPLPRFAQVLLMLSLISTSVVLALGDFPCAGTNDSQSCGLWSVDPDRQGNISRTAACVPDPLNPTASYCGYARAPCVRTADCDYGTCGKSLTCQGYLGDPCPNGNVDCQAFFFCGSDRKCGGAGAACANGDPNYPIPFPNLQCMSQSCVNQTCSAVIAKGIGLGGACVQNNVCESGYCSDSLVCACSPNKSTQCAYGTVKTARQLKEDACPQGLTLCPTPYSAYDDRHCVDTSSSIENCGGCSLSGSGTDCTAIDGVESVQCNSGQCVVLSCSPGLSVNAHGSACTL